MNAMLARANAFFGIRATRIRVCIITRYQSLPVHNRLNVPKRNASSSKPSGNATTMTKVNVVEGDAAVSTVTKRVVAAGKTTSYFLVVVCGIGVTLTILLFVFRELFASDTPSGVYDDAVKRCRQNEDVRRVFGEPIRSYGEETSRGRRRYTANTMWVDEKGRKHMLMRFYLAGPSQRGVVHLEVEERISAAQPPSDSHANTGGATALWNVPVLAYLRNALRRTEWQYRYLVVETTAAHARQIRVEPSAPESHRFGLSSDMRRP